MNPSLDTWDISVPPTAPPRPWYVEAVTPTLSRLHPSALIDGLHSQCLDRLKQQNKLKKGKEWEGNKEEGSYDNLSSSKEVTPVKTSSLQALFTLPKINICVLQASIVEEVIAFSNLGSVSDLTAVSLLAVCIDGVKCQLLSNKHSCKAACELSKEPLTRKTSATPNMVKFSSSGQSRGKADTAAQEPDIENPQEVTREENVGTLQISHIHVQLRRLLKFSNFSEHVLLTAIPEHSSRVLFTLEQDTSTPLSTLPGSVGTTPGTSASANTNTSAAEGYTGANIGVTPSPKRRLSRTSSRDREREREKESGDGSSLTSTLGRGTSETTPSLTSPYPQVSHAAPAPPTMSVPSIGFIMCECGLEDVSVTTVRRLGYQDIPQEAQEVGEKLEGLDNTINQMEDSARSKVEEQISKEDNKEQDNAKGKPASEQSNAGENVHTSEREKPKTDNPTVLISSSGTTHTQSLSSESGADQSSKDSSWASDHSAMSSETPVLSAASPGTLAEPLEGDASNGRLELKTIWFYFASPPPISIHKKVDYTRLDWNLLSTATPAIDAWLNPSDRLMTAVRSLVREYSRRLCCVVACMMIEGLESQGIHVAYKSKFNKLTPLSKTLQEDPSNQLLTVLRKYLHKHGTDQVERAVSVETVPQLITVQKGILALMRQWKNVLYMPNLNQVNFKSRRSIRPYNVKFALPKEGNTYETGASEEPEEAVVDQFDVVDERMSLLQAEGGVTQRSGSVPSIGSKRLSVSTQGKTADADYVSAESFSVSAKPRKLSSIFRSKLRAAGGISDSPLDHSSSNLAPPPQISGLLLSRNDSNISFTSMSSSSNDQEILAVATPPHTPLRHPGPKQSILKNKYHQNEDLYQWMAKQQTEKEQFRMDLHDDDEASRYLRQNTSESCAAATGHLGSAWSQDDSKLDLNDGGDYTMATSIMQLADAQILFKPVLQSLGLHVESVRPSTMMKKFGGHLLLQGHITTFKILIAESEARPGEGHQPSQHPSKGKGRGKRSFNHRGLQESPAFQCERFDVNVSLEDVVDFGEDGKVSKFPYKFAMHKLEAKPTTLQINLLVNCQAIRQNVDMALLRLAHQVLTMVGNVKETRVELKQKRMEPAPSWVQTHRKQDSKDSTSSVETNQSDTSHTEHLMGSFSNILALEKDRGIQLLTI
ncbi:hypothetical protein ElyMa_001078900 [Elysia marginata]|uniref:Bridge-like lipid transfer protein family member 1 middle region domain-containing protein n=1 Tax=Elysia marginata TaxID=1093978 RepID=A0AAV4HVM8_9GAST|nr:hypothetical protein ElyMa_001078900 [Elysia marginata]